MKKVSKDFVYPLLALILLTIILSYRLFNICPLGKFLNPFIGALQNTHDDDLINSNLEILDLELLDSVNVFYDDRKVPHIFAKNDDDLFFCQGYITASLRLWQMDFITYACAGRLSEIFGDEYVDSDRTQRRRGLLEAATNSLELISMDAKTDSVLTAYTNGVNAYIDQLNYKKLPLEYKVLDYIPEHWTKLKTILILKYMGQVLSGYEEDISMTDLILMLDEKDFNALYPSFNTHVSSITDFNKQFKKENIKQIYKPDYLDNSFLFLNRSAVQENFNPKLGSNNWVVSGKKTKSGHTILCNDPHLSLSLPSIWLEMQLSSPSENVYGVSIPGTPSIIIGFNKDIAWGMTNGAIDVKDWYKLKLSDDYKRYKFDSLWKDLKYRVEEIKIRNRRSVFDTVLYTVHGPIIMDKNYNKAPQFLNLALKWTLAEPSNEFSTFIKLNKAKSYEDYKKAIANYNCPIQNFVFAGKDAISINVQGKMYKKWEKQGKFILDGSKSSHLYSKFITQDSLPHLLNPECQYVFSANQYPTNPDYKYYYNGYFSDTRANRINNLLSLENSFDIKKMQEMQMDNVNIFAVEILPLLLRNIDKSKVTISQLKKLRSLEVWNGAYSFDSMNAKFFELWLTAIRNSTWDELNQFNTLFHYNPPSDYVLFDLIKDDPNNKYFDRQDTDEIENSKNIIVNSFLVAFKEYEKLDPKEIKKWGDFNMVNISHMTRIEAFSQNIYSSGCEQAINSITPNSGPSWRMIVELGDIPTAYGILPGGESGNVSSKYYDNSIADWTKGKYYKLNYFLSIDEAQRNCVNMWKLK